MNRDTWAWPAVVHRAEPIVWGGLIAVTVLSGDITVARFLPGMHGPFTQIRIWGTLLLLVVMLVRRQKPAFGEAVTGWATWTLAAFCAYVILRALPQLGSARADEYILDMAVMLADVSVILALGRRRAVMQAVLWWIVVAAAVLFLLGLAGVGRPEIFGWGWSPIGSPTTLYRIEAFGAAAAMALATERSHKPAGTIAWMLVGGAFLYGALASLARIVPVALAISLPVLVVGLAARRQYRPAMATIGVTLAVLVIFETLGGAATLGRRVDELSREGIGRLQLFKQGWQVFQEHPVWGGGPDGFAVSKPPAYEGDSDTYLYPHNIVVEALAFGGIVGTTLLLVTLFASMVPVVRAAAAQTGALALGAYLPFALTGSLVSGDLYDARLYWYAALIVALLYRESAGTPGS